MSHSQLMDHKMKWKTSPTDYNASMSKSKKPAKKTVKRRLDIERPYCNGQWTIARMRSFAMSALRGARWNPRMTVIKRAFIRKDINPATGKPCNIHECELCGGEFPQGKMRADHNEPVIPNNNNWAEMPGNFLGYDFNEVMRRLWIEKGEGWNVICEDCHHAKTAIERTERAASKQSIALRAGKFGDE